MKKSTIGMLILLSFSLSAQKMYVYDYDNAGNRISRDMVPLRIEDPGGSSVNDQLVQEERSVNNEMESKSLALDDMEISPMMDNRPSG